MIKKSFAKTLSNYKKRIYSQTMEDGVIEGVFNNIGTTNKYFVEFGAWDGQHLSNTANLRINENWEGLLLEGNEHRAKQYSHITHAFITADNINSLFEEHNVPKEYDLLSIDLDGNDFWVWKAIDETKFNARVVIIEYNCNFTDQYKSCAIKYSPHIDTTVPSINYYSATIPALKKLGESKGYSLIYRINLHNLVFVRTDLLHKDDIDIPLEMFLNKDGKARKKSNEVCNLQFDSSFGYDPQLYKDTFRDNFMTPHWNEYASTNIVIWWDQDFTREWIEI
jgi:hypothetical protein